MRNRCGHVHVGAYDGLLALSVEICGWFARTVWIEGAGDVSAGQEDVRAA